MVTYGRTLSAFGDRLHSVQRELEARRLTAERQDHVCPANDCQQRLARHVLMCRPHWRMVPKVLQRDVNATWRTAARLATEPMGDSDRVQAVRDYLVARREAVNFVNGRLSHD